jgi:hypothetical protein
MDSIPQSDSEFCHYGMYDAIRVVAKYVRKHNIADQFGPRYISFEKSTFANPLLPEDIGFGFYKFHGFVQSEKLSEPKWLKIESFNRLVFNEHCDAIRRILYDAGFVSSYGHTFRWDIVDGKKRFVKGYELFMVRNDFNLSFVEDKPIICTSKDPRADRCVFELIKEYLIDNNIFNSSHDSSYDWTTDGFELTCYNKKVISVIRKIYFDCKIKVFSKRISEVCNTCKNISHKKKYRVVVTFPE